MENLIEKMGLTEVAASLLHNHMPPGLRSARARASFQWGGTLSALILLILNRTGRRSANRTTLLVLYLFTSFPAELFKILRGQFGYWIAFVAVAGNLFFPESFPVSRFTLFVVTPDWLADGLRDSVAGGIFCLIVGILLLVNEIRGFGGFEPIELGPMPKLVKLHDQIR